MSRQTRWFRVLAQAGCRCWPRLVLASLVLLLCWVPLVPPLAEAQPAAGVQEPAAEQVQNPHGHGAASTGQWEGSPEGKAYSEFNHHLAGVFVLLIGASELRQSLAPLLMVWMRFLLPVAMLAAGGFLMIWSDHEAWPIGSLGLLETFSGNQMEMTQHKIYGLLLLGVGAVELVRRTGKPDQVLWKFPLPALAIVGGLLLFIHSHGPHPAAHKIAIHHAIMGILALAAGVCKLVAEGAAFGSRWAVAWAGLILVIGLQLLVYSE